MPLIDPVTMSRPSTATKSSEASQPPSPAKTKKDAPPTTNGDGTSPSSLLEAGGSASYVALSIPAIQLQILALLFQQLVSDPVAVMSKSLLPAIAVTQVVYVVVFLPVAGSSAKSSRKLRPGEKKRVSSGEPNVVLAVLLCLLLTLIATPPLHAVMVLFGAPFLTHVAHTFLCALNLSLLVLFPLFYTRGVDAAAWSTLAGLRAPFDENVGAMVGACIGAWLGAVPIPLDWDRNWQRWPVTVLTGIYIGYAVGSYAGRTVLKGRKF